MPSLPDKIFYLVEISDQYILRQILVANTDTARLGVLHDLDSIPFNINIYRRADNIPCFLP